MMVRSNITDDNHKPEMTIAITPFTGLCGFRPLSEVAHFVKTVPALRKLLGDSQATAFTTAMAGKELNEIETESEVTASKKVLKETFNVLMNSSKESISAATNELLEEVRGADFAGGIPEAAELSKLIPTLNSQFPDDIGTFVLFFLNYVKLAPGEAMFLKANDIHAYISGGKLAIAGKKHD
jgi:mannose-6-phosphate isomerase